MTSMEGKVRLYELALADGRSASPFVWRIRYALAHKGIPYETVYLGFTEIPTVLENRDRLEFSAEHRGNLGESQVDGLERNSLMRQGIADAPDEGARRAPVLEGEFV